MADADLVLEGGGVKGSALVGAVTALAGHSDPYTFHRIAGTSAGAIVASLLAARMSVADIRRAMDTLDFSRFEDQGGFLSRVPRIGPIAGLLLHQGMYKGGYLYDWIRTTLADAGVVTWADLKDNDPLSALPPPRQYRLVVVVSDVSRGLMLRLPWDYEALLGVDPDTQPVADAIRASASIPFFFRPWRLPTNPGAVLHDHIICTDGGMLSNFPLQLFDRNDGLPSRWPTLGVKLSGQQNIRASDWKPDNTNFQLAASLLSTMIGAHDRAYVSDPMSSSRTVFVDTSGYRATDFRLKAGDKTALFAAGAASATKFLSTWDWEAWQHGKYAQP